MIGRELKLQLAKLALQHRVRPIERAPLPLLSGSTLPQIVEGFAATSDIDADRMAFVPGSLSWPDDLSTLPLVFGHTQRVAGSILSLENRTDGKLAIKARADEGRDLPAFSICAVVTEAEIRNANSICFHGLIHKAMITHVAMTDRPSNPCALVTRRCDVDRTHDDALAAIERLRKGLEAYVGSVTAAATPTPSPLRSLGAAPPLILGRLPAAILTPRRNDFRNLIARLPIGEKSP
ncbi:hypothetical protein KIP88_14815 [Bradyrhizobium sp. SRL28]|uniref:hypothetical protein n=1 Tax=Bradyrhizobium sp. SRL28 TaxID=2836178 RepID=UPI001BDE1276|nr:hypothetical protein [Bradyrhizobium sp. SRL28]MBT1511781.1 hypothetical protein [Bradyrhizobium sp. SRL28]